jgi:hypothetical protein
MNPAELLRVAGVPESRLDDTTTARLPDSAPPAPWECACEAVVWVARATRAAARAIGTDLPRSGPPLVVIGGLVRYLNTPVGAYDEVLGAIGFLHGRRPHGTVPFIAVDSPASLVGGRSNWALPKSLASFDGDPEPGSTFSAQGAGWRVAATIRSRGPSAPTRFAGRLAQVWPDGLPRESVLRGRATARPALIRVEVESDGPLAGWLRPGWHVGATLRDARFLLP